MEKKLEKVLQTMKTGITAFPQGAKCTRCKAHPVVRLPSHHANFCRQCFIHYFETAVARAMEKFGLSRSTPLLVAVSGGKDSLSVWQVLHDLGYATHGLHIDLGIEGFSEASALCIERFARERNLPWIPYSLKEVVGYTIPEIKSRSRRKICGVCGLVKRQLLNRLTLRSGFRTLVVGHNLDDEAGRLLGNMVRHRTQYFEKQYPFLPSNHPRVPAKLKPLYRLEAREIRTYCELKGISPLDEKCPLSRGATSHSFKEALDFLEDRMPGTKRDFLFTYLNNRRAPQEDTPFGVCSQCGEPAFSDLCGVCTLLNQLKKEHDDEEAPPIKEC